MSNHDACLFKKQSLLVLLLLLALSILLPDSFRKTGACWGFKSVPVPCMYIIWASKAWIRDCKLPISCSIWHISLAIGSTSEPHGVPYGRNPGQRFFGCSSTSKDEVEESASVLTTSGIGSSFSAGLGDGAELLIRLAGTPTTVLKGGTSFTTTALAPTIKNKNMIMSISVGNCPNSRLNGSYLWQILQP